MSLKIDMEQAYNRMSWDTLVRVMHEFGFPQVFIKWVISCISNPRYAMLINGRRTNWIDAKCGFRQGCPLSPYLFILCSELLSISLTHHHHQLGVTLKNGGTRISHLLYADDILLFGKASIHMAKKIQGIVLEYCNWTGQRVNNAKSSILFSKAINSNKKKNCKVPWVQEGGDF